MQGSKKGGDLGLRWSDRHDLPVISKLRKRGIQILPYLKDQMAGWRENWGLNWQARVGKIQKNGVKGSVLISPLLSSSLQVWFPSYVCLGFPWGVLCGIFMRVWCRDFSFGPLTHALVSNSITFLGFVYVFLVKTLPVIMVTEGGEVEEFRKEGRDVEAEFWETNWWEIENTRTKMKGNKGLNWIHVLLWYLLF